MYTVHYASRRDEIWRWYWRAWRQPAGLWRYHVLFGVVFGFVFAAGREPDAFRLGRFLAVTATITAACVVLFPLWPQLRFKSALRTLSINEEGIQTTVGSMTSPRIFVVI